MLYYNLLNCKIIICLIKVMETDLYKQLCLCVTSIVLYTLSKVRGVGAILYPPPFFLVKSYVKLNFLS